MNLNQLRNANRSAFVATVVLFILMGVCATYWLTVLLAPKSPIAPAEVVADPNASIDVRPAGPLFGVNGGMASGPAATVSNVQVLGLAAARDRSAVVLALDGKAPRAYAVGDLIAGGIKLLQIDDDKVVIERDGARVELPAPARPALALLNSGTAGSGGADGFQPGSTGLGSGRVGAPDRTTVSMPPGAAVPASPGGSPPSFIAPAPGANMPPPPGATLRPQGSSELAAGAAGAQGSQPGMPHPSVTGMSPGAIDRQQAPAPVPGAESNPMQPPPVANPDQ